MRINSTNGTWKHLGEKVPYYGVFGLYEYVNAGQDPGLFANFLRSGENHVNRLFETIHTKFDPSFKPADILDFGCGPGRLLLPFSRHCNTVTGLDVSPGMIHEARKNCEKLGVNNAELFLTDQRLDCIRGREYDMINSYIVFQHIRVRRGERTIRLLLDRIRDGGFGVIHVTYHDKTPLRPFINFCRNNIPGMSIFFRFLRWVRTGKPIYRLPQMFLFYYNLNRIFRMLQDKNIRDVYTYFTDHYNYGGIVLVFRKEAKNQN